MESTILALFDAFNRRDWTALDEFVSPDLVVEEAPGHNPEVRTYRGRDEFRAFLDGMFMFWARVNFEVLRIFWAYESRAVVGVRNTLTGRGSGVEVSSDSGTLFEYP